MNVPVFLSGALEELSQSSTALRFIDEAQDAGWSLTLDNLEGPDFHLDVPEKLIVLDDGGLPLSVLASSSYFRSKMLISLIRALRDVWQEKRHGAFDDLYRIEDVLTLERCRAADLDVIAVLVAWELRQEEAPALWRHMIGAEEGDLALAFLRVLERAPTAQGIKRALGAAFQTWFEDEIRIKACDHETLNYLDDLLAECGTYKSFGRKVTPIAVEALSCLPDRTAYLHGSGMEILSSPFYAGLSDMINQSHFMQILHDMSVTRVQDVPFRDSALARKIFPENSVVV